MVAAGLFTISALASANMSNRFGLVASTDIVGVNSCWFGVGRLVASGCDWDVGGECVRSSPLD